MKVRPILFKGPMVRAILSGQKTQTRRPLKVQDGVFVDGGGQPYTQRWDDDEGLNWRRDIACPYGEPGDRLWVRESWAEKNPDEIDPATERCMFWRASNPDAQVKWRPSIHMPRWASRITLEVTRVRAERVQSISGIDAQAEGIRAVVPDGDVTDFKDLWDSINSERGFGWEQNPWVWVIEFKKSPTPTLAERKCGLCQDDKPCNFDNCPEDKQ